MRKEARLLRIGVLGCGPISQFAHFDACQKAKNAELYAICDVSADLRERMAAWRQPKKSYGDFSAMLADADVEAIIIAVADQFHVPLCRQALAAGKHVLVEKPLGTDVEECLELQKLVASSDMILQVGNNRRFDPGIAFARDFVREEMGQRMSLAAWYYDSTYRYSMTDNLQPIPAQGQDIRRPAGDPKSDKRRYFMLTHGSHLVDTARYFGGEIVRVQAQLRERYGAYCWFASLEFADGAMGHLDLHIATRGDFEEGFRIQGEFGSASGRVYLPWYHKSSLVECFSVRDAQYRRPLGEDAHTYKRQVEAFSDAILLGKPLRGATAEDGVAAMRAMVAIARSVESGQPVALDSVRGSV